MKKRFVLSIVIILFLLALPLVAGAAPIVASGTCGQNVTWTLDDEGLLIISGTGDMTDNEYPWSSGTVKNVVIQEGVTSIGKFAFGYYNNNEIASVSIPDSVIKIGTFAFNSCYRLEEVTIPANVSKIGDDAFGGCDNLSAIYVSEQNQYYTSVDGILYNKAVTELLSCPGAKSGTVTIPDTVTTVDAYAFRFCGHIERVNLPETVTSIGEHAFSGCHALTEINLPDGIRRIEHSTFSSCYALDEITLPANLTYIGGRAFSECNSLKTVIIPDNVTIIDEQAFYGSSGIEEIVLPDKLISIGKQAFWGCSKLHSMTIPPSVIEMGEQLFYDYDWYEITLYVIQGSYAESYAIENSINYIAETVLQYTVSEGSAVITRYVGNEEKLAIPAEIDGYPVTAIGGHAFEGCTSLRKVTVPDTVISIGEQAFKNCTSLQRILIPASVTTIGSEAFAGCESLTIRGDPDSAIQVYAQNNQIPFAVAYNIISSGLCGDNMTWTLDEGGCLLIEGTGEMTSRPWIFSDDKSKITSVVIEDGITSIMKSAFGTCTYLTTVTIANSVTDIGTFTFTDCARLTDVVLPEHLETIGMYVFSSCRALTNITIPESVTSIGDSAFYGCSGLTHIELPDGLKVVKSSAFSRSGITSLTLPPEMTSVASFCANAETVYFTNRFGNTAHLISNWADSVSFQDPEYPGVNLRYDADDRLLVSRIESGLTTVIVPEGVVGTEGNLYVSIKDIDFLTLPGSLQNISRSVFWITNVKNITLQEGITEIADSTFSSCNDLISISLPEGLTNIGKSVFSGCSSLTDINIPSTVTSIGEFAFSGCSSLTEITIPGSVTSIGKQAFYNCSGLTDVTIQDGVISIDDSAFYNCTSLKTVSVPDSVTSINNSAFGSGIESFYTVSCTSYAYEYASSNYYLKKAVVLQNPHVSVTDPEVPPTCAQAGKTEGTHCSLCGRTLIAQQTIAKLPHTVVIDPEIPATDTESGLTEGSHCSVCGEVIVAQEEIPCSFSYWNYEIVDNKAVIQKYTGTETNLMVPEKVYDYRVTGIAANAFEAGHVPARVYLPAQITSIDPSAFASAVTVYCDEFSEADYWAEEAGYQTVYTTNTAGGNFYLLELEKAFRLQRHGSHTLEYSVWPMLDATPVSWVSSAPDIVSVNDGTVTALLPGQAVITLSAGGSTKTVTVTVYGPPDSFALSDTELLIATRTGYQLQPVQIEPAGSDMDIVWQSSNESIVTVDQTGLLSARRPGTATVTATTQNNLSRSCEVTVCYPPSALAPDQEEYSLKSGETGRIVVQVTATDGTVYENKLVEFISSDESILTADRDGTIHGIGIGQATVTVRASDTLSVVVTVNLLCPDHHAAVIPSVAATCTETGLTEGQHCPVCGEIFAAQETVPALGHDEVIVPAVAPTTKYTGLSEGKYCKRCGEIFIPQQILPRLESNTKDMTFYDDVLLSVPESFYTYTASSGKVYYRDQQSDIIMSVGQDTIAQNYDGLLAVIQSRYSPLEYSEFTNDNGIRMILTLETSSSSDTTTYYFISNSRVVYLMFVYSTEKAEGISTDIADSVRLLSGTGDPVSYKTLELYNKVSIRIPETFNRVDGTSSQADYYKDAATSSFISTYTINYTTYNHLQDAFVNMYGEVTEFKMNGIRMIGFMANSNTSGVAFMADHTAIVISFNVQDDESGRISADVMNSIQLLYTSALRLPSSLQVIEDEAFEGLTCEAVIIPEGCTSIGNRAFAGCVNLKYVSIPSTVKSYPDNAFEGCSENLAIDWKR